MAFDAKAIKTFIAYPDDIVDGKEAVRKAIGIWNTVHAEVHGIVYVPISWDYNMIPGSGRPPQDYINEEILDKCDILIGLFNNSLGSPNGRPKKSSVEEVERHVTQGKRAMVYFAKAPQDSCTCNNQDLKELKEWKETIKPYVLYGEFADLYKLTELVERHLSSLANERKYRVAYDSDNISLIDDDNELANEIKNHFPTVAYNLLKLIYDQERSDIVWQAMVDKLSTSSAELRDSLVLMAQHGAFKHYFYISGYQRLAEVNQTDFGVFMSKLYAINKFEFIDILGQGLFAESEFKTKFLKKVKDNEIKLKNKHIIV